MRLNLRILYNLGMRERLIIAAIILLIVGYLIYILLIPIGLYHYRIAKRQLYVQSHLIDSKERKTKNLLHLEKTFNDLQSEIVKREIIFFTESETSDLLKNLDNWADETKNDLQKIKPLSTEVICDSRFGEGMVYKKDIVEVVVQGRYNSFLKLFNRLVDYEKLLGINQVDIRHTRDEPSKLKAKFVLNIYILGKNDENY